MDNLKNLLQELESTISAQKENLKKEQQTLLQQFGLILAGGAVAASATAIWLPCWAAVILIFGLAGFAFLGKQAASKRACNGINKIADEMNAVKTEFELNSSDIDAQLSHINEVDAELAQRQEIIDSLTKQIELLGNKLNELPAQPASIIQTAAPENPYGGYTDIFLRLIQSLDSEIDDFGEECTAYIRNQFARSLRSCGLKLVGYSDETKDYFRTERTTLVTDPDCTTKAVITTTAPTTAVIKGHAFIPEN